MGDDSAAFRLIFVSVCSTVAFHWCVLIVSGASRSQLKRRRVIGGMTSVKNISGTVFLTADGSPMCRGLHDAVVRRAGETVAKHFCATRVVVRDTWQDVTAPPPFISHTDTLTLQ